MFVNFTDLSIDELIHYVRMANEQLDLVGEMVIGEQELAIYMDPNFETEKASSVDRWILAAVADRIDEIDGLGYNEFILGARNIPTVDDEETVGFVSFRDLGIVDYS